MNNNTGLTYCNIQAAIDDPLTLNFHTIIVSAGTYAEHVIVNKKLDIRDEKNIKDDNIVAERVKEVVADFLRK